MAKRLTGMRVAVLAADGFEQVELTSPVKALKRAGADVDIISLHRGKIRGMNLMFPGKKIPVEHSLKEVSADEYDALFIPGGFVNPDFLRQSDRALAFVTAFDEARKPIASLCHGPWVLVSADRVRGRELASWPGIADDIRNAGGIWKDAAVVRDGNWVTSRTPLDLPFFKRAMLDLFERSSPSRGKESVAGRVLPLVALGAGVAATGVFASRNQALRERIAPVGAKVVRRARKIPIGSALGLLTAKRRMAQRRRVIRRTALISSVVPLVAAAGFFGTRRASMGRTERRPTLTAAGA